MKIAYVGTMPIPSTAANAVHMMKMSQALAHNGHDVALFTPQHPDTPDTSAVYTQYGVEHNFKFNPIPVKPGRAGLFAFGAAVTNAAKEMNADLVFSRCLVSAWMASRAGLRVLFEKHSSFDEQGFITKSVFKSLTRSKNFAGMVVISHALKDHLLERFRLPANKVFVAADGADALPENPLPAPFPKQTGSFHAGYIGHLYKGRGIDIIAGMARQLPDVDFHIVGGNSQDVAYWKQQLADCRNIAFHGHVPHSETIKFLKNFDVLLAPYQRKVAVYSEKLDTAKWMSPLKIFEYMSSGIPMISSDLEILHEVLENGRNAWLCEPEDATSWTHALTHIRRNPEEARRVAENAKADLLSRYTWRKRAENIIAAI